MKLAKLSNLRSLASTPRVAWGIFTAAIFAVAMTASAPAQAQYGRRYAPQPSYYPGPSYRYGLVAGVGVGVGALNADQCAGDCGGGLSLEGHIGGMVDPRLAAMFDAWAIIHPNPDNDSTTTSGVYTGALQFWLTPILWLKGGAGIGNTHVSDSLGNLTSATAFALMGAGGVELVHSQFFALDVQGRLGHTFFTNAEGGPVTDFAFMVGFNWY